MKASITKRVAMTALTVLLVYVVSNVFVDIAAIIIFAAILLKDIRDANRPLSKRETAKRVKDVGDCSSCGYIHD